MGMNPAIARGIGNADGMGGGNWPKDGRYRWCVERVWEKQGFKGHSFIINFLVVSAEQSAPTPPDAVGSTVSYTVNITKNPVANNLIKTALCAILGEEVATEAVAKQKQSDEVTALLVGYQDPKTGQWQPAIVDPPQPLRGLLVDVEVFSTRNSKGGPLTKETWRSVKMSQQEKADWRAKLDKERPLGAAEAVRGPAQAPPAQQQATPQWQPPAQQAPQYAGPQGQQYAPAQQAPQYAPPAPQAQQAPQYAGPPAGAQQWQPPAQQSAPTWQPPVPQQQYAPR